MYRNNQFMQDFYDLLQTADGAREYLFILMEGTGDDDEMELEEALKTLIQRMGVKEFCQMAKVKMPNVIDFIKGRRKPKPETLNVYLKPFGLRLKFTVEKIGKAS